MNKFCININGNAWNALIQTFREHGQMSVLENWPGFYISFLKENVLCIVRIRLETDCIRMKTFE